MAAIEPDDIRLDEQPTKAFRGWRHRVYPFTAIDNGDIWTSGIRYVRCIAFEADSIEEIAVTLTDATTGQITFNCITGMDQAGNLHVWNGNA